MPRILKASRGKLFLENFIVYGLGGMISKFIPLIMLPIVTRLYPNTEYMGLNDLSTSFVSFASALAVCGMYDAMFRCYFDNEDIEGQKKICSTALLFVACVSTVLAGICLIFRKEIAALYFGGMQYEHLVVITILGFLMTSTNQILAAPTRIQNKRKLFIITNTLTPAISYSIAIPLILNGYYIVAIPLATVISGLSIEISFGIINRKFFSIKAFSRDSLISLIKIGIPLMPNFVVYWIYNSADKVMISQLIGTSYTGIYAVASRIGHVSNLIYNAFSGGWLYFAYSTMRDEDQVQLKSNIFEYLGVISFACTILLMVVSNLLFRILFPSEYLTGYLVAPYLFLAPLLLMLYQVVANQFSIIKKTYLNLFSLSLGAIINVVLNFFLIRKIGIEGAAIATITGYIISIMICLLLLTKMELIYISRKSIINILTFSMYFALWRKFFNDTLLFAALAAIIPISVYLCTYLKPIMKIVQSRKK